MVIFIFAIHLHIKITAPLHLNLPKTHTLSNKQNYYNKNIEIKKAFTFLHFMSLIVTAIVYMGHFEKYQGRAVIASFGTFVLAFCIPPIGMISPDDAPDATRKALGWMPERGDLGELKEQLEQEEGSEGKNKKKSKGGNNKKKKGKKND